MSFVHVDFDAHDLDLLALLLEVIVVDDDHLGLLDAGLSFHELFKVAELGLLVQNELLFLGDLVVFLDESFLQGLALVEQFEGFGVGGLELAPAVNVDGVLDLLGEALDLQLLLEQFRIEPVLVVEQVGDLVRSDLTSGSYLVVLDFAHDLRNFVLLALDFVQAVLVLGLALAEVALVDLDLFVQNLRLLVAADQLRAQDVSFGHHQVVLLLQLLPVLLALLDDLVQLLDLLRLR